MNELAKETQQMLRSCNLLKFEKVMVNACLTDEQIQILVMCKQGKSLGYIADHMGYSVRSIKYKKSKALTKIAKCI